MQSMQRGQWMREFKVRAVETPTTNDVQGGKVWTWVDGPNFDGDADCIIPGYFPEVAVQTFVAEVPYRPLSFQAEMTVRLM